MAAGVMAIWCDCTPEAEADFNEWYFRQHIPERVAIPGFLHGRRYVALARGRHRYHAVYEAGDAGVFTGAPYLHALNQPTPWTQRVMPQFRNFVRSVLRVRCRIGRGRGGVVASLRPMGLSELDGTFAQWLADEGLPALLERPGVCGCQLWEADAQASQVRTAERQIRPGADSYVSWALQIDGTDAALLRAAIREHLGPERFRRPGAGGAIRVGYYRLIYSLDH